MARDAELRATITAKDDASKVIDKVADAAKDLEKKPVEVKVDADVAGVLSAFDQIAAEAKQTADAADVLARALGPELAAKADTTAVVNDLKNMGLSIDQIKGNADQLAAKMKELSDLDVGGKMGSSLGTARGQMEEFGKSGSSAISSMANSVGNNASEMGAALGLDGPIGQSIGEFGEYMTEARLEGEGFGKVLSNFGKVAGPIAAISLVTKVISDHFGKLDEDAKFADAQMHRFADSIAEGADSAGVLRKELESTGKLEFKVQIAGPDIDIGDAAGAIARAGLNLEQFAALGDGTRETWLKWADGAKKAGVAEKDIAAVGLALAATYQQTTAASQQAIDNSNLLTDSTKSQRNAILGATLAQKARVDAIKATDAAEKAADNTQMYLDQAAGIDAAAKAAKRYADTVGATDFGAADLEGAVTGMSAFRDQFFSLADIAAQNEAAFDSLGKSLKDNGDSFDLNTDKGRNNQKAIEDLSAAMDTQLAAAFADSDGRFETFRSKATTIADTLRDRLIKEMGLSGAQADDMIRRLGLMPADIETRYKLSGTEEAKLKLDLLSGSIDDLPKDVQAKVTQQIIAGDYVGALNTIQNYYDRHPVTVPVELRVSTASLSAAQQAAINAGRSVAGTSVAAPAGMAVVPFGATTVAPAAAGTTAVAPVVVPVMFQMPTAASIARRIGPVRIPLFVQANLLADRRINGNL